MSIPWLSGLKDTLLREGYTRTPEDVVERQPVETGPPQRRLRWPTRFQRLQGQLMLRHAAGDAFEDWMRDTLDHGTLVFDFALYDHSAPRAVTARFQAPPQISHRSAISRVYALDLRIEAPAPQPADLAALAALHYAGAATWPPGVPAPPRRADYASAAADRAVRGNPSGPSVVRLKSRQTGEEQTVSQPMTPAELEAFETWFETTAAFGARDIAFPRAGGTHLGCFASGYTVIASTEEDKFIVRYQRYLEAVA